MKIPKRTKFTVRAHIPRGSGDAEYQILTPLGRIAATVDPMMILPNAPELADLFASSASSYERLIAGLRKIIAAAPPKAPAYPTAADTDAAESWGLAQGAWEAAKTARATLNALRIPLIAEAEGR